MDWNTVIEIVMALVLVVVTRYAVPYLKKKLEAAGRENLAALIEDLVKCAEQVIQGVKMGNERKEYVKVKLSESGVAVDPTVDAMIEAEVYRMKEEKAA